MLEQETQGQAEQADAEAKAEEKAPAPEAPITEEDGRNIEAIFGVKLDVRIVLGRNQMPVSELLKLTKGSVIELDRKVGEPVDVMINDRVIARGDLVKVQGDMIGVALREIVKDFVSGA
jgi:flagellar motor switch protein FliN/FliY